MYMVGYTSHLFDMRKYFVCIMYVYIYIYTYIHVHTYPHEDEVKSSHPRVPGSHGPRVPGRSWEPQGQRCQERSCRRPGLVRAAGLRRKLIMGVEHTCIDTYVCNILFIHVYIYIYICMYTYTYIYIYIYTHACIYDDILCKCRYEYAYVAVFVMCY